MEIKLSSVAAAGVFGALGDENRRRVLALLRGGSRSAGALGAELPVTKATLSHHLRVLLEAGLVRCARHGRQRIYSINTSVFEDVGAALAALFTAPGKGRSPWPRTARAG